MTCVQSQEALLEHSRLAGINCMALVSDKEGSYVKVNEPPAPAVPPFKNAEELWLLYSSDSRARGKVAVRLSLKVKSFEKDRQSEKRIPESDLADHIIQKCRNKFFEDRSIR